MQIKSKTLLRVAALTAFAALAAPVVAQETGGHEGHDMSAMMSVGEDGAWSYLGRENPQMRMHGRWQTVPLDGHASAAVSATAMTRQERCAALMAAQDLMQDHATRVACTGINSTMAEQQAPPSQQHGMDHGMDHGDGGHDN